MPEGKLVSREPLDSVNIVGAPFYCTDRLTVSTHPRTPQTRYLALRTYYQVLYTHTLAT